MYLWCGWEHFSRAHDLQLGHLLVFRYDGDVVLTMKVFDGTMCRRHYQHDDDASNGSSCGDDEEQKEQSGEEEVQPILADDELAMVLPNDDLTIVVPDDDLAMVVRDDGLEMVVPDDGLAMVVVPVIPQLGDMTSPIVVEDYIRIGIRHCKRIRMLKEKEKKEE
uniref:TF-B3 domain-containing protein n=1 Tax=Hordeum vulgare subsp. vulgare TaxID=112509 RepID=A0A8I6Y8W5_HORVV